MRWRKRASGPAPARRRFWAGRSGASAVEFALIAPPFLAVVFSIFEVGWFHFVNSQVDAVTLNAARIIRTGQVAAQNLTKDQFYNEVCPSLSMFGDCRQNLTVEVRTFPSFAALAADTSSPTCADARASDISAIKYEPGTENSIIRLRICMMYKTLNPALGVNLTDTAGGKKKLYGSYLFRNEPFARSSNGS